MTFKKGFTLIELLVVIAIIAILLSLIFPSLSKIRYTSNGVVCQNNLKQLATAVNSYLAQNRNLPYANLYENTQAYENSNGIEFYSLSYYIKDYIDGRVPIVKQKIDPWICPHDKNNYMQYGSSYEYNAFEYAVYYRIPLITIYERTPLLPLIQDIDRRKKRFQDIVRLDGSALEINLEEYNPNTGWISGYIR